MPQVTIGPFSINMPTEWLSSFILTGPPTSEQGSDDAQQPPFVRNVVVARERVGPDKTAEWYVNRQIIAFTQAGISLVEKEQVKLTGGLDAFIIEGILFGIGGMRLRQMYLFCVDREWAFNLVATHLDGDPFDMVRTEFREMLLSFKPVSENAPQLQSA